MPKTKLLSGKTLLEEAQRVQKAFKSQGTHWSLSACVDSVVENGSFEIEKEIVEVAKRTAKLFEGEVIEELKNNKNKKATINQSLLQAHIIADIKEMDMDSFIALIEYMYPVKATDINEDYIEIAVDENQGLSNLGEIF